MSLTPVVFPSLGDAWATILSWILENGSIVRDDDCRLLEVRNLSCAIEDIDEADPVIAAHASPLRVALMCEKYASTEIVPPYPISYGGRLYDANGVDQVALAVSRLRSKPETKSASLCLQLPGDDYIPCLIALDFKLRDERLDMSAIYRSQNVFASQPGNLIALRRLQRSVAAELETVAGRIALHAMSAHIYEVDWTSAAQVTTCRVPRHEPSSDA